MAKKIQHILGIDIGTESVGSAWVDMKAEDFDFAVKRFLLRSDLANTTTAVFRAVGVAIPPSVQKTEE
ncbi:MAG: hypothetical protein ABSG68_15670 [Thermoguttaceae bacterium]|jgi:CRISPR/Cas system Type II protein with McrA/HNH and RuvC-like nuclease domain